MEYKIKYLVRDPNTHSSGPPQKVTSADVIGFTLRGLEWAFLCAVVLIYISVICWYISMHLQ